MRKKRKKNKRKLLKIILLILILFGLFYFINSLFNKNFVENTIEEVTNNINNITKKTKFDSKISYADNNKGDFTQVKDKIISVLNLYYQSIYYLEENDFSIFFNEITPETELFNKAVSYQVNIRKSQSNDLTLSKASYDLEFETIEETYSKIIVTVKENATLNYNFMKNITSKYYNIESTFTFDKDYNLISYRRDQDFYSVFTENLDTSFTNIDVDNIYDKYYKIKLEDINKKSTDYNNAINDDYVGKTCDNEYNRHDALSYAKKYINTRNTNDWDIYDDYGGNCQNFGSQVLYAGGIPKDVIGDDVWKYYSAVANNTNNKTGRSSSWTTVGNFYNYAKNNTGYGLCATVDANVYYALPGDIMQVGYDDEFIHTIVVSGVIKKDNNVIDVITNSNTTDFENVPISSFSSTSIRLIKIDGWNNY